MMWCENRVVFFKTAFYGCLFFVKELKEFFKPLQFIGIGWIAKRNIEKITFLHYTLDMRKSFKTRFTMIGAYTTSSNTSKS